MNENKNTITEQTDDIYLSPSLAHLPIDIQYFLQDLSFDALFEKFSSRNLLERKSAMLVKMVTFGVLTGTIPPNTFVDALSETLKIDRRKASYLAQEINRDIFSLVKESLRELYGLNQTTPAQTPSTKEVGSAQTQINAPAQPTPSMLPPLAPKNPVINQTTLQPTARTDMPKVPLYGIDSLAAAPMSSTPNVSTMPANPVVPQSPSPYTGAQLREETTPSPYTNTRPYIAPPAPVTPPPVIPQSVFEQKMSGTFVSPASNLPSAAAPQVPQNPNRRDIDPYREPIE